MGGGGGVRPSSAIHLNPDGSVEGPPGYILSGAKQDTSLRAEAAPPLTVQSSLYLQRKQTITMIEPIS